MAETWTADELDLADQLEGFISDTPLWEVEDWTAYPVLGRAAGISDPRAVTADAIAEFLADRINLVSPPEMQLRIGMLLGLLRGLWGKAESTRREAIKHQFDEHRTSDDSAMKIAIRRRNTKAKRSLAREILRYRSPKKAEATSVPSFYERPLEQRALRDWLESSHQIIALYGDSGNGKSTIVAETLSEIPATVVPQVVALDASTPRSLIDSMKRYLGAEPGKDALDIMHNFNESILSALSRRAVVFIDNATDWQSIEALIYWSPRCIVTAEQDLVPADDLPHITLLVDPLDDGTATKLVLRYRPQATIEAARSFAKIVGKKPRIIVDCLSMFKERDMTIESLIDCLESEEKTSIGSAPGLVTLAESSSRGVGKLYKEYFIKVEHTDPVTAIYLAVLAHLGQTVLPVDVSLQVLDRVVEARNLLSTKEAKDLAVQKLKNRCLIELKGGSVYVSSISLMLFREAASEYRADVYEAAITSYMAERPAVFKNVRAISGRALQWIPALARIFYSCTAEELWYWKGIVTNVALSDIRVGLIQLGQQHVFLALATMYYSHRKRFLTERLDIEESDTWIELLYESGCFSRESVLTYLESRLNSMQFDSIAHCVSITLFHSRVTYQYDQFLEWLPRFAEDVQGKGVTEIDAIQVRRSNAYALEWIGRMYDVAQVIRALLADFRFTSIAVIEIGRQAVVCASKLSTPVQAENFMKAVDTSYLQLGDDLTGPLTEAHYLIAKGWYLRSLIEFDSEYACQARDCFLYGSEALSDAGLLRQSLEVYIEAIAVNEWCKITSPHGMSSSIEDHAIYKLMCDVASKLDEPHSINRILLIMAISESLKNGSTDALGVLMADTLNVASQVYRDIRTVRQGLTSSIIFCEETGLPVSPELFENLFLVQSRYMGQMNQSKFDTWFNSLKEDRSGLLLL